MMIGSLPPELKVREHQPGHAVLAVKDLHLSSDEPFGVDLNGVNFQVRAGEVVGIAGVSGNGQRELLFALSGEDTRASSSSILLNDEAAGDWGAEKRRRNGLHFVPEERLGRGAVPSLSLAQNLLLTRDEAVAKEGWLRHLGWLNLPKLQQQAKDIIERYQVKAGGPDAVARSLSGGNLQKFIVGREIEAAPKLLIVSQPTWGVDVGASAQIRAALLALRDAGCAVLVVSEELEELLELSDVLYVIANGKLSPPLKREEAEVSRIGAWMSGLWHQDAQEVSHVAS
jgi:simple sugar transport system ATP-binding protein